VRSVSLAGKALRLHEMAATQLAETDQKRMVLGGRRGRVSRVVDRGAAMGSVVASTSDCDAAGHNKKVPASIQDRPHRTLRLFANDEIVSLIMHVRQQ
jgi:hypothetical protein